MGGFGIVLTYFSGATLGKGVNRGIATLLAGALGVGAHSLATSFGQNFQHILLGLSVFLFGKFTNFYVKS